MMRIEIEFDNDRPSAHLRLIFAQIMVQMVAMSVGQGEIAGRLYDPGKPRARAIGTWFLEA
jgi:hypothetical protein